MEKSVKIKWEGQEVEVVQKTLLWKEIKKAREECIVLKEYKGNIQQFRSIDLMDDLKILASITKAPFEVTMDNLDKLTEEDRYILASNLIILETEKDVSPSKSN